MNQSPRSSTSRGSGSTNNSSMSSSTTSPSTNPTTLSSGSPNSSSMNGVSFSMSSPTSSGSYSSTSSTPVIPIHQLRDFMRTRLNSEPSIKWMEYQQKTIGQIDDIINRRWPKMMQELNEIFEKKFTKELRERNIQRSREILEKYFPIPKSEKEVENLRNWYLSLDSQPEGLKQRQQFTSLGIFMTTGTVPRNDVLLPLLRELSDIAEKLRSDFRILRLAFRLLRPELAHADNNGVDIQHSVEAELEEVETLTEFDGKYFRPEVLEKDRIQYYKLIWQHPQSLDLHRDFLEFEASNFDLMKFELYETILCLTVMLETVKNNLNKIKNPRNDIRSHSRIIF